MKIRNIQLKAQNSQINLHVRVGIDINQSNNNLLIQKALVLYQDLFQILTKGDQKFLGEKSALFVKFSFEDNFPKQEEESFNEEENNFEEEILEEDRFESEDDEFADKLYYK